MTRFHAQEYDLTLKDIFRGMEPALVQLLTGTKLFVQTQELDFEFPVIEKFQPDFLFETVLEDQAMIFHVEFQTTNDPDMSYRMLRYATEILSRWRKPVFQAVLYAGQKPLSMLSELTYLTSTKSRLLFEFELLNLSQLDAGALVNLNQPDFLALLPLTQPDQNQETYLQQCVDILLEKTQNLELSRRQEILLRTEVLAGLRFPSSLIEAVFRKVDQMLMLEQSAGYQRIHQKGKQEGKQEGLLEGLLEGKLDTARQMQAKGFELALIAELTGLSLELLKAKL